MPVPWTLQQVSIVKDILKRYPAQSNQCDVAARAVLPIAREVDASSQTVRIDPAGHAPFLLPRVSLEGDLWRYHVTTQVAAHYVDCLTDSPGTVLEKYFAEHYQYDDPEAYQLTVVELPRES